MAARAISRRFPHLCAGEKDIRILSEQRDAPWVLWAGLVDSLQPEEEEASKKNPNEATQAAAGLGLATGGIMTTTLTMLIITMDLGRVISSNPAPPPSARGPPEDGIPSSTLRRHPGQSPRVERHLTAENRDDPVK